MTPEEIKKLQADLKAAQDALEIEKKARADEKAAADRIIAEKDAVIAQKNADIIGIRKENTKLKELTEEEKSKMSQMEIAHHEALLAAQKESEQLRAEISERNAKEISARRARALDRIVGTKDAELRKKVEEAYGKILDHDKAQTEEEIMSITQQAFNMLGVPKPAAVDAAVDGGGDGGAPGEGGSQGYAESAEGKKLAEAMGLPTEAPKPEGGAA